MKREIRNSARALTDEMTRELLERVNPKLQLCTENMSDVSQVCFTVVGETEVLPEKFSTKYKSAIVFGKAEILEDGEEKMQGILALMEKYSPDFLEEGRAYAERAFAKFKVIKIVPEYISGKGRIS